MIPPREFKWSSPWTPPDPECFLCASAQCGLPPHRPARIALFSSARRPAVAVYPDSDKLNVNPGNPEDRVILQCEDGNRDYWDREA